MLVAPIEEGAEHGPQLAAVRRQVVGVAFPGAAPAGLGAVGAALQDALVDEGVEPGGQYVGGDAE